MPIRLRPLAPWWSIAASLTFASWAAAVTVDLSPSKDNTLIETPVGNSNGAGDGIYVGRVGALGNGTKRRGVLAFDVSSIPVGSTVNSATLSLEMAQAPNALGRTVTVHRVNADWGEQGSVGSGSGGTAVTGDATWIFRFFNTVAWTAPGGDFVAGASASQLVADIGPYAWTGSGLVSDVQFWVEHAASNFGWLLQGDETTTSTVKKFYSREGLTPPKLTVTYTPPAADVPPELRARTVWFAPPWPVPASGSVHLSYTLSRAAQVSLSIHDLTGHMVRRLRNGDTELSGAHAAVWDGRTDSGSPAPSGLYFARLVVDQDTYRHRIPLVR